MSTYLLDKHQQHYGHHGNIFKYKGILNANL